MKKHQKEILKLTASEALLSIFDLATPFFKASSVYRLSTRKYKERREIERSNFLSKIKYLKKQGLIENFVEGKERYIEITPKGLAKINQIQMDLLSIERPVRWDSKWRVVLFDVPKKHNGQRDILRDRLIKLGFHRVQESVYVYPFECTSVISGLTDRLSITPFVLITVAEIMMGEEKIIESFLDRGVLQASDLKKDHFHART